MADTIMNAENNVIGSLLIDPKVIELIDLVPDDFLHPLNRDIYSTVLSLHRQNEVIDPLVIQRSLESKGEKVQSQTLIQYMEVTGTAANIELYAKYVKNASESRVVKNLATSLMLSIDGVNDYREDLETFLQGVDSIRARDSSSEIIDSGHALEDFIEYRKNFEKNPHAVFVKTGFSYLDDMLGGGMLNGGFYILAARPGMGKTTTAINIAEKIAGRGESVLFFSLEMSQEQITAKRLSMQTGMKSSQLLMKPMNDEEYKKMMEEAAVLSKANFNIHKKKSANILDIQTAIRKHKPKLLIIDYLGLIKGLEKGMKTLERVTENSHALKEMALNFNIPILCLAQLNRENQATKDKRPQLHHLRDSGDIEQDADGVLFVHREEYYSTSTDKKSWENESMELIVAKNRFDITGTVNFVWCGQIGKIVQTK